MWKCPKCDRQFKHKISDHSCVKVAAGSHFKGKNSNVKVVYEKLLKEIKKFGNVNVSPVTGSIMHKNVSTFLGVRVARAWLDIDFFLPVETHDFPIHRTMKYTKSKTVHYVRLEDPKEVDKQLIRWLKISYTMSGGK